MFRVFILWKNFDNKVSVMLNSDEYMICFEYIVVERKNLKFGLM